MFLGYLVNAVALLVKHYNGSIDYIIVLGSWGGNGTIPPLLKSRVYAGINYYKEVKEKYGDSPKFVVSGGKGEDEIKSEAQVMAEYLLSVGVGQEDIIVEDKAKNTLENFEFSKSLIEKDWTNIAQPKIIFSTSNYHVMRASGYAKGAGINVIGIGASTSFFLAKRLYKKIHRNYFSEQIFIYCCFCVYVYFLLLLL